MNRNICLTLVFGALALLICADTAQAQRRYGGGRYGGYNNYSGFSIGFGQPYYGGYGNYAGYGRGYGYYPNYGGSYNRGYGYSPYTSGYGYYPSYGYSTGSYYSQPSYTYQQPYYSQPSYTYQQPYYSGSNVYSAAPNYNTQSMYSDPNSATARIRVTVPTADTRLIINGAQTTSMGTDRVFESPTLEAGRTYTYTLQATWMQNGREVTRQQDVQVRPGQETQVAFRLESANAPPPPPAPVNPATEITPTPDKIVVPEKRDQDKPLPVNPPAN